METNVDSTAAFLERIAMLSVTNNYSSGIVKTKKIFQSPAMHINLQKAFIMQQKGGELGVSRTANPLQAGRMLAECYCSTKGPCGSAEALPLAVALRINRARPEGATLSA